MSEQPLRLNDLARDFAEVLAEHHGIELSFRDVRRGLVPFLETIAPGVLTDEQRFGLDLPRG